LREEWVCHGREEVLETFPPIDDYRSRREALTAAGVPEDSDWR
jgi:hypothetical protein